MKTILILALSMCANTFIHAQSTRKVAITDCSVFFGTSTEQGNNNNLDFFKKSAPNSKLLSPSSLDKYSNFYIGNAFSASNLNMNIGMRFLNKNGTGYKYNPLLRMGISFTNNAYTYLSGHNNTQYRIDTATLSSNGNQFFIDSTSIHQLAGYHYFSELRFETSLIFRTSAKHRISLYGGATVGFGKALATRTNIYEYQYNSINFPNSSWTGFNNSIQELHVNKNGYSLNIGTIMGIDYRLSKKHDFWKNMHLCAEVKPNLIYRKNADAKAYTTTGVTSALGLRVTF
jgi:hypothetical protein